jgi:hypothetical protein
MTNEVLKRRYLIMALKEAAAAHDIVFTSKTSVEDLATRFIAAHGKYDFLTPEGTFLPECDVGDWLRNLHKMDESVSHLISQRPMNEDEYTTVQGPFTSEQFDALPPHIRLEMANRFAAREVKKQTYGS